MTAAGHPPRRAALQRPTIPDHPFAAVPVPPELEPQAPPGAPRTAATEPSPRAESSPPAPPVPGRDARPGNTSRTDAETLVGGRRSLAGRTTTITFSSEEEYGQVKLAFAACGLQAGFRSLNEFMTEAVLMAVEDLERQYNNGLHFTDADVQARRRARRRSAT